MSADKIEKAVRTKLRFDSPKGLLDVEQLWDLPLIKPSTNTMAKANLDDMIKEVYKELKNDPDISFVTKRSSANEVSQLKFDILKYIIDTKIAERDARADSVQKSEKKQVILAAIAQKENEALLGASVEELRKMADSLN